jgi:hypothetical protein
MAEMKLEQELQESKARAQALAKTRETAIATAASATDPSAEASAKATATQATAALTAEQQVIKALEREKEELKEENRRLLQASPSSAVHPLARPTLYDGGLGGGLGGGGYDKFSFEDRGGRSRNSGRSGGLDYASGGLDLGLDLGVDLGGGRGGRKGKGKVHYQQAPLSLTGGGGSGSGTFFDGI